MILKRLALACLITAGACTTGAAQPRQETGGAAGAFDFYVLALSWSPGFCELDGDRERNREQCGSGANPGFVVHGLWPQNERGYPSDCGPAGRTPSRLALEQADGVFPTQGLARYQWRKHGSCSGSSPDAYFADARRARDKIAVPEALQRPERDRRWTAAEIERAFSAANPGLRGDMMSVSCRRGVLEEVRICLTRDLRNFRVCEEVDRAGCSAREITVNASR